MRKLMNPVSMALLLLLAVPPCSAAAVDIGAKVENFSLPDAMGNKYSLSQYSGRVIVLSFWAFKCPVSLSYDDRLGDLLNKYANSRVVVIAVDSNANESPDEIRANLANLKLPFPVLLDSDGSLADRLNATMAPTICVIDGNGMLRYRGSLDNGKKTGDPGRVAYVEQAIEDILAGRGVKTTETRANGCPIRRRNF